MEFPALPLLPDLWCGLFWAFTRQLDFEEQRIDQFVGGGGEVAREGLDFWAFFATQAQEKLLLGELTFFSIAQRVTSSTHVGNNGSCFLCPWVG